MFDVLNSRKPLAKSFKAALQKQNKACWRAFFSEARAYIKGLKDPSGRPILEGLKKTGFVGYLICIASTKKLFNELVGQEHLKYLLTHKLSQDHAENFFGCIRGRGGCNNNPTAAQFMASYRRLLIQTEGKSSNSGNFSQDMVSILTGHIVPEEDAATSTLTDTRRAPIMQPEDHDYTHHIDCPESLSPFVTSVVPYNAGFVVRKVCSTTTCQECIAALHSQELAPLVRQKNRGGLVSPSQDVVGLCEGAQAAQCREDHEDY